MQSHILRIPKILYSLKLNSFYKKCFVTFIFFFLHAYQNIYLEIMMSFLV